MKSIRIFVSSVLLSLIFIMASFVMASESDEFIMTEDTFSSVQNTASTDEIISESIILPIQYIGETSGDITERTHELSVCGNGIQEFQEVCDGGDFNGKTCNDFGFNSGTLTCSSNCLALVSGACNNSGTGLEQTPTPIPTATPIPTQTITSSGGGVISTGGGNGGGSGGGGGGRDPLLLLTPTPQPTVSLHPVASANPTITPIATENPSNFYVDGYEPSGTVSATPTSTLDSSPDSFTTTKDWTNIDTNMLTGDISSQEQLKNKKEELEEGGSLQIINEDESEYSDITPPLNDILKTQEHVVEKCNVNENNIFEKENSSLSAFHSTAQQNMINRGDETLFQGCGKYYWIILLIVFLLGMLTEYIISSVLLIYKK